MRTYFKEDFHENFQRAQLMIHPNRSYKQVPRSHKTLRLGHRMAEPLDLRYLKKKKNKAIKLVGAMNQSVRGMKLTLNLISRPNALGSFHPSLVLHLVGPRFASSKQPRTQEYQPYNIYFIWAPFLLVPMLTLWCEPMLVGLTLDPPGYETRRDWKIPPKALSGLTWSTTNKFSPLRTSVHSI